MHLRLASCWFALVVALAPASLAQQPTGRLPPGPQQPSASEPPEAVDHEVVIVLTSTGPPRTELVTVTRSGARQREDFQGDGVASTKYEDSDRGISMTWVRRDDDGEYFQASQYKRNRFLYERTGQTQRWAGETCELWSQRLAESNNYGGNSLICVTSDGIELWRGYVSYDGTVNETFHAMLVQRRDVRPEEMRLPAEVLDWKRWRAGIAAVSPANGYEAVLDGEDGADRTVVRKRGEWTLNDSRFDRGGKYLGISHPQASLNFTEGERERVLSMARYASPPESIFGKPVVFQPPREETILGRRCIWYDTMPNVADAGAGECRSADGAVLAQSQSSRGRITRVVRATRFSPAPPSEEAFVPLPETFSWIAD